MTFETQFTPPTRIRQDCLVRVCCVWRELATSQDCRRYKISELFCPVWKCCENYWKQSWLVANSVHTTDKTRRNSFVLSESTVWTGFNIKTAGVRKIDIFSHVGSETFLPRHGSLLIFWRFTNLIIIIIIIIITADLSSYCEETASCVPTVRCPIITLCPSRKFSHPGTGPVAYYPAALRL